MSLQRGLQTNVGVLLRSYFYLEQYSKLKSLCSKMLTRKNTFVSDPEIKSLVRGLLMHCHQRNGNKSAARALWRRIMNEKKRVLCPVLIYCRMTLAPFESQEEYKRMMAPNQIRNTYRFGEDIQWLFWAMHFAVFSPIRYQGVPSNSISVLKYCTHLGTHPIIYYRLHQCYQQLGLYWIALQYLKRAEMKGGASIPSLRGERILDQKQKLVSFLRESQCTNCGTAGDVDRELFACSGCLDVFYCSRRCQKISWNSKGHRKQCHGKAYRLRRNLKDGYSLSSRGPFDFASSST